MTPPTSCVKASLPGSLLFILSLALTVPAASEASGGSFAFESLLRPLTALQTAMGGPPACSDPGPEAVRSNPAALARADRPGAAASHQGWQGGLSQEWIGGVLPLGGGSLGIEASAVHAGPLPAYDAEGASLGSFTPVELVVGLGVARSLLPGFRCGVAAHGLSLGGGGGDLRGVSFSLGAELEVVDTRFAVALRDIGPDLGGEAGSYALPSQVAAGLEREIGLASRVSLTGVLDRFGDWSASGGVRVTGPARFSLLCGAAYLPGRAESPFSPRAGIAAPLGAMLFAYSYAPDGVVGSTHHFSVEVFGR